MGKKKESLLSKEGTHRTALHSTGKVMGSTFLGRDRSFSEIKVEEFSHYRLQALSSTFLPRHKYAHGKQNRVALMWNFLGIHLSNAAPTPPCMVTAGPWVAVVVTTLIQHLGGKGGEPQVQGQPGLQKTPSQNTK